MTITIKDVKQYLRISYSNDDNYLELLIKTAKQLIEEQTGVVYNDKDEIYRLAILQVVSHFYDKRESFSDKSLTTIPYTMDCLIKHLGMRGNYE